MNKEQIKSLITSHDKDEEFTNLDYPDHKKAFIEFLEFQGFTVDENDLKEKNGDPYIDSDGIPGIDAEITIISLNLTVSISAFHHKKWDFYFNY